MIVVRWLLSLVVLLAIALLALLAVVVGTQPGTAWLAREAELLTGGAVRVENPRGTLADGIDADALEIRAGTTSIRAAKLRIAVSLAPLVRGLVEVERLHADQLVVTLGPKTESAAPFEMPTVRTPVPVKLDALAIDRLEIRQRESVQALTGVGLSGSMAGSRVSVAELHATLGAISARVAGHADLEPGLPLDAVVQWRVREPEISGAGSVRGTLASLDVRQALRVPGDVSVTATVTDVAGSPALDAAAAWDALGADVPGVGPVRATLGRATLAGTPGDWRGTASGTIESAQWPAMRLDATAHGSLERIVVDELRLDGSAGKLAAAGAIDVGEITRLDFAVKARDVDTEVLRPGLKGRLSADARVAANFPGEVRIGVARLDGRLMNRPLAGRGDVTWREGELAFAGVDLRVGANRLKADGSVGERLAGTFSLEAPELGVLWPGLSGRARAHAKLAGTRERPVVALDASGARLALDEYRVGELELAGRVDRSMRVDARLSARGLAIAGRALGDLSATLDGTLDAHRFAAEFSGGPVEGSLASAGSWNGTTLRHRLESATVREALAGEWRLEGTPELTLSASAAALGPHCWRHEPASLCFATLAWSPGGSRVQGELRDLDLELVHSLLPEDFTVSGHARATAALSFGPAGIEGSVTAALDDTTAYYTGGDEPLVLPLRTARLDATIRPDEASVDLEVAGESGLRLSGRGGMQAPLGPDGEISGVLEGVLPDIAPLVPLLAPDVGVAEVAGRVTVDGAVGGTLRQPQFTGVARLAGGAAAIPDLGVKLEDVDVALLGDGSPVLRLEGSAKAGGLVTLRGQVRLLDEQGPSAEIRVRGNRIYAVRLPDRLVQASPDLTVSYDAGIVTTQGRVTIPKADLVIRELPESAASPSPDAIVHDREAPPGVGQGQVIRGEIEVVLGRDVHLKAFGLDTMLEGTVTLKQGEDREPKGYGVVRLREGKFGAYGKELTIERGTLGFAGPLDDPTVDLRASRTVDWEGKRVTAGILLAGTASRPESRVFSNPAMSEADALSYLISGRPMQSTSANDQSAIAGAALALGVQQTSPLTQRLGSAVTLDELGLEGSTLDETEVVAGKQISSDLYVRFTYGLFSRIGSVLARYKIGRNVSIEAASGEDQSLDLIYSIERD